jgi:hypothetical protein
MKEEHMRKHVIVGLLAVLSVQHSSSVFGQTTGWQTTDNFRAGPDLGASAGDIGTDASGTILYSVGSAIVSDGTHMATVRASDDFGLNWNTLSMFLEPPYSWAHYRGFSFAPDGALFVSGELYDPAIGKRWLVRRSIDQGFNWTTVDSPAFMEMGSCPSAGDIKIAASGEVYAAGTQSGGSSPFQWVVRKSSNAGNMGTWASVDVLGTIGASEARGVAFNSSGAVFVAGHVANAQKGTVWTVRRSQNKGALWTTVDSYQETSGLVSGAEGITVSASGTIYVAGYARGFVFANGRNGKGTYSDYWVVRRSTDGGSTWANIDKSTSGDGSFLSPTGLITDGAGSIWVCGYTGPSSTPSQWIARNGTPGSNGTISWINRDIFQEGGAHGARPNGITTDAVGNIFVTGRWSDAVENWWLTRKLSSQ